MSNQSKSDVERAFNRVLAEQAIQTFSSPDQRLDLIEILAELDQMCLLPPCDLNLLAPRPIEVPGAKEIV